MNYWLPGKLFQDDDVFIIGGGPSLKGFNWDLIKEKKCIGCNDAYTLGAWVDMVIFGDEGWYDIHKETLHKYYHNPIVTVHNNPAYEKYAKINVMKKEKQGLFMSGYQLAWNQNTGALAINLALVLGAKRIILLGFDMELSPKGEGNWHPNMKDRPNAIVFNKFCCGMSRIANLMVVQEINVPIINANPNSKMNIWPKMELKEILEGAE